MEAVENDDYVTIPREEYESMKATIETLKDENVMRQIRESEDADSKGLDELKEEM